MLYARVLRCALSHPMADGAHSFRDAVAYGLGFNLGVEGTLEKARREYVSSLVACWQIWFPASVRRAHECGLTWRMANHSSWRLASPSRTRR